MWHPSFHGSPRDSRSFQAFGGANLTLTATHFTEGSSVKFTIFKSFATLDQRCSYLVPPTAKDLQTQALLLPSRVFAIKEHPSCIWPWESSSKCGATPGN